MGGAEFRAHRTRAQLSVRKAAEVLDVAPSTIQRWESEQSPIPSTAADRMRSLGLMMAEHTDPEMAVAHVLGRLYGVLESVAGTEPDTWESPATWRGYRPLVFPGMRRAAERAEKPSLSFRRPHHLRELIPLPAIE